jgi:hypothetical protein
VAEFTPPEALTPEMAELLKFSDELMDEFLAATFNANLTVSEVGATVVYQFPVS